jgi:hypothetical protein
MIRFNLDRQTAYRENGFVIPRFASRKQPLFLSRREQNGVLHWELPMNLVYAVPPFVIQSVSEGSHKIRNIRGMADVASLGTSPGSE